MKNLSKNIVQKNKVALGMSGGVDSSVAAYLLKEQGYDVTGVYMQCWDEKADGCTADEDRADAAKVAGQLGIPFKSLDFKKEYMQKVIDYFYAEYKAGRTPNPDILCNKEIKFGMFLDWALKEGFDFVATGHYARVLQMENGEYALFMGKDPSKDQSYFLYLLGQEQLKNVLFPLGELTKQEIRKKAQELSLHTANKPDSTGICFIGEVDIKDFLSKRIKKHTGEVKTLSGEVIGTHDGVEFYTIGQRHGFKIDKYQGKPLYVVSKDSTENVLFVGDKNDCYFKEFTVSQLHWIRPSFAEMEKEDLRCQVRVRHLGELKECIMSKNGTHELSITLEESVFGLAAGQSSVFYIDDEVLGGGVIN